MKQINNNIIVLEKNEIVSNFFEIIAYADYVFKKTNKKGIVKVLKDRSGKLIEA
jgi:hypothetical protein